MSDTNHQSQLYQESEWLQTEYHEKNQPLSTVADIAGVSVDTVRRWMEKHNIETRDKGQKLPREAHIKLSDYDWMYEKYVTENNSIPYLATKLSVAENTVRRWLHRHEIDTASN